MSHKEFREIFGPMKEAIREQSRMLHKDEGLDSCSSSSTVHVFKIWNSESIPVKKHMWCTRHKCVSR
jgi:hypothetical protein